jgi:hypothetical protein
MGAAEPWIERPVPSRVGFFATSNGSVYALLAVSGFVVGLVAGGMFGAWLAVSAPQEPEPVRFVPADRSSAGLDSGPALQVDFRRQAK